MKKGGYKIIDFEGTELSSTAVEILGIFEQIMDNYEKPILVSGVILDGELQDDAYADVKGLIAADLSKYLELTVYGGVITVTEDGDVTFAGSKTPAELTTEIGDLEDLETTEKESVVGAINELVGRIVYSSFNVAITTTSDVSAIGGNRGSFNLTSEIDPNYKSGALCIPLYACKVGSEGRPYHASIANKTQLFISSGEALDNTNVLVQVIYIY